jgi:hypothetical protein
LSRSSSGGGDNGGVRWLCGALLVGLASCAGQGPVSEETTTTMEQDSVCAGWTEPQEVGRVADPTLDEISGLAASRAHAGILWAHEDSGVGAVLWALDATGATAATLELVGAQAIDWEDAALMPSPTGDYLYVADTGDNLKARSEVTVYRVPEPAGPAGTLRADAEVLRFSYPDGPHDVEAMFVDPATGDLYLIAKVLLGAAPVFRLPASAWGAGGTVAEEVARLDTGLFPATAADLSPDGRVLAVRTYGAILLFTRAEGAPAVSWFTGGPCTAPAPPEAQGEAIAWQDGTLVTISEGGGAALYRISPWSGAPGE